MMKNRELLAYDRLFGLIGYPLSHSFSKKYFSQKFGEEGITSAYYELFPLEQIEQFPELMQSYPNLVGLNVTIPYKQAVMPYLDTIDPAAAEVGAVNTIRVEDGRLTGYNTDVYGFEISLRVFLGNQPVKEALVLGTGGAAKAVMYVLHKMDITYQTVSRDAEKGDLTYTDMDELLLSNISLIINTTPLGMAPHMERAPDLPYWSLNSTHFLYDLVYNPEKTVFLSEGIQRSCPTKNGLEMLYLQAEKAWSIWNT